MSIRIYDLGEGDGVKFITMEFIEGQDLRTLIHERKKVFAGRSRRDHGAGVPRARCRALREGVIHRDLKPQNIMRDKSGRILVMDFGLARTVEGDGMTQTGALVGTMEYMSPEQALAKELDQRSDIFSVGSDPLRIADRQDAVPSRQCASQSDSSVPRNGPYPISAHDSTIPEPLSNIVSKCLEREPAARYQTAKELLADLDAWEGKRAAARRFPRALSHGDRRFHGNGLPVV